MSFVFSSAARRGFDMLRKLSGDTVDALAASAPQQCARICTSKSHLNEHGCMNKMAYKSCALEH